MKTTRALTALFLGISLWLCGCSKPTPPAAPKPIQECKDAKVLQDVMGTLSGTLDWPIEDMKPDMRLVEDLSVAGPGRVQIRMDLESAFGIKIHEDEIKEARTVSELAHFVEEKMARK